MSLKWWGYTKCGQRSSPSGGGCGILSFSFLFAYNFSNEHVVFLQRENYNLFLYLRMLEGFKGVPLWINFQGQVTHHPWKKLKWCFRKKKLPFHFLVPLLWWANNPLYKATVPEYTSCTCLRLAPGRVRHVSNLPWLLLCQDQSSVSQAEVSLW